MVKSAYYSQLPTIRCRDCGQVIDFDQEHHCYAGAPVVPEIRGEQLQRIRNPKPYPADPYTDPYAASPDYPQDPYPNPSSRQNPGYANSYEKGRGREREYEDRGRSRDDRWADQENTWGKTDQGRPRDPNVSSKSSRRDRSQHRDKSRARGGSDRERPRERRANPDLTNVLTKGLDIRGDGTNSPASSGLASSIDAVMADLMNEMVVTDDRDLRDGRGRREGREDKEGRTRKRPTCGGCNRKITDPSTAFQIDALRKFFHITCFRCYVCNSAFDERNPYIPYEGRAYCEPDFNRALKLTCAGCNQPIFTHAVYALGKAWHEQHLRCAACREPIQGNPFEHDNQVYCSADYAALVAPTCRECGNGIQGETICALNSTFHKECFVCKICKEPFPDKSFYVLGDDPLCRFHYHESNNSLCGTCDQPIEGPCAEVMEFNKRYHPECWCCYVCQTPLTATYYSFANRPYCEMDIMKVYRQEKANRRQTLIRNI
ncbi:uncharacterized protein SPPG_00788 [Spizellomyces punctatus DAOM BR117]|uniref:LIM zinc-binding domain-containing protein n=1 Tax=Spizellomyces punctatus (strain DAOM BR117) TaxID=645134 RepID=A0A0L0HVL6_SPIPD|nr:uncharacterized protein SPPG_00788 [Spizellomyces punctatus DAOM BR117]KND05117.1 hypothetical protein SPPG_00788 [Spizellomyces punctatus DAOM BR117]|eukprot:XP_016613156.1 hypothetical protein SPPG_00788 [Spizellomyces punctatus DAOM BR117]